jgi:FAD binding domain/Mandelate racemase / muconate lactonizing enzyme, N-terminal domain
MIDRIEIFITELPTRLRRTFSSGSYDTGAPRDLLGKPVLVKIYADGTVGCAQIRPISPGHFVADTVHSVVAAIADIYGPNLLGRDIADLESIWEMFDARLAGNPAARAVLDNALYVRILNSSERTSGGAAPYLKLLQEEALMNMNTDLPEYDVIVGGGGNAALCAALSARDEGARVLVLERASIDERGDNSAYTDGLMRVVYEGADDIRALAPDLTEAEMAASDFGSYTESDFFDDMARITQSRTDPDLCEILVKRSKETLLWMRDHGVRFMPNFGRQAFKIDNKFKFWGGATIAVSAGRPGLIDALYRRAEKMGIEVIYNAWVRELVYDGRTVFGVLAAIDGGRPIRYPSKAVVLACGSFEANAEWRAKYLGPGWELAKVRGTRFNTGDELAMALAIGAQSYGHWSGCHSVAWERYAADFGDLARHGISDGVVLGRPHHRPRRRAFVACSAAAASSDNRVRCVPGDSPDPAAGTFWTRGGAGIISCLSRTPAAPISPSRSSQQLISSRLA